MCFFSFSKRKRKEAGTGLIAYSFFAMETAISFAINKRFKRGAFDGKCLAGKGRGGVCLPCFTLISLPITSVGYTVFWLLCLTSHYRPFSQVPIQHTRSFFLFSSQRIEDKLFLQKKKKEKKETESRFLQNG